MQRFAIAFVSVGCLVGCSDLSTPADLAHPQIIAVRAEPPVVAAGERAALEVLVAGPDGVVDPAGVQWTGLVELDGGQAFFVAPAEVEDGGLLASVEVAVTLDDGELLEAVKTVGVEVPLSAENPRILSVRVDGLDAPEGQPMPLLVGDTVALGLVTDPPLTQDSLVSWYATDGEIEQYRRVPTELVTPDDPADAVLIAVYRVGLGVAWREVALRVE